MPSLSQSDLLLQSVATVSGGGKRRFSAPSLIVVAWEQNPDHFGLAGKVDTHPDSSKILIGLSGKQGLVAQGYIERTDHREFMMTDAGRARLAALAEAAKPEISLSSEQQAFVLRLLRSAAVQKVDAGKSKSVTKSDMEAFYGITEVCCDVDKAIESVTHSLDKIDTKLDGVPSLKAGDKDGEITVLPSTIRYLKNVGSLIQEQFARYLNMLRSETITVSQE